MGEASVAGVAVGSFQNSFFVRLWALGGLLSFYVRSLKFLRRSLS